MKRFITLLTTLLISINVWSQLNAVYPVDLAATITPPYGTCLKDYVGSKRFQVHALLRDMTKKSDQFVIELSVKNSGGKVIFRSSFGNYDLAPGKPYVMPMEASKSITSDLFDVKNITIGSRYATECFPEGSYTFSFQAFSKNNYPQRRIALSRESVVIMFLQATVKNPYLVMPYDKDSIPCETSQIMYQWQSANPTGERIAYHLQVAEMNGTGSANSAIASGNKVVDKILYNTMYLDQETSGKYQKNTKYAWTVTVNDAPVKENTVRTFVYCGTPQQAPEPYKVKKDERKFGMSLDRIDMDTVEIKDNAPIAEWFKGSPAILDKYCAIGVEIRKYGQEKWTPYVVSVSDTSMSISDISYDTKYQVRAQYIQCNAKEDGTIDSLYAPYSDTLLFSLPNPVDTTDCSGDLPELADCSGSERIILKVGDEINANGTMIGIDSISYNAEDSTIVSGLGHLAFPIIKRIGVKMQFKDIKVNCKGQLAMGAITSVYDPSTSFMIDIEELTGEQSGGGKDNATSEAKTTPYSKEAFDKGNKGDYFVKSDSSVVMKDSDGNEINIGQLVAMDGKTFQNRNHIADATHCVKFSNSDKKNIAFDDNEQGYYKTIMPNDYHPYDQNNQYVIPWMANNPGKVKLIDASELNSKSTTESFDSVMFVIPASNNTYINLLADNAGGQYKVHIPGTSDVKHSTEIHAIGRMKGQSTFINAGKMMVANYAERTHKLIIVPTHEDYSADVAKIQEQLNAIYGRVGVTYTVEEDRSFTNDELIAAILEDGLDVGADDESRWQVESGEMKLIRRIYEENHPNMDKKSAYLFLVNYAEKPYESTQGDMPRNQSVGYIFMKDKKNLDEGRVLAHELGHGVYKFQHTFAYKNMDDVRTDNLMDYNDGDFLAHYQWRIMQDSVMFVWKGLQDDEDGMAKRDDELIIDILYKLKCAIMSGADKVFVATACNDRYIQGKFKGYYVKIQLPDDKSLFTSNKVYDSYYITTEKKTSEKPGYGCGYFVYDFDQIKVTILNKYLHKEFFDEFFFKKRGFIPEVYSLRQLIKQEKTEAVDTLYNYPICVYEALSFEERMFILKCLVKKSESYLSRLSENYEEMVLNILRVEIKQKNEANIKKTIDYFFDNYIYLDDRCHVFNELSSGIDNWWGKSNYNEYILLLTELFNEYYNLDEKNMEYLSESASDLIIAESDYFFVWNFNHAPWTKMYKFSDIKLDNKCTYTFPYHVDYGPLSGVPPYGLITVHFGEEREFMHGDKTLVGKSVIMPAFTLAFLLNQEKDANLSSYWGNVFEVLGIISGVSDVYVGLKMLKAGKAMIPVIEEACKRTFVNTYSKRVADPSKTIKYYAEMMEKITNTKDLKRCEDKLKLMIQYRERNTEVFAGMIKAIGGFTTICYEVVDGVLGDEKKQKALIQNGVLTQNEVDAWDYIHTSEMTKSNLQTSTSLLNIYTSKILKEKILIVFKAILQISDNYTESMGSIISEEELQNLSIAIGIIKAGSDADLESTTIY